MSEKKERKIAVVYRDSAGLNAVIGTPSEIVEYLFSKKSSFINLEPTGDQSLELREVFMKDRLAWLGTKSADGLKKAADIRKKAYEDQCKNFVRSALKSGWIKRRPIRRRR